MPLIPYPEVVDLDHQALELPEPKKAGQTGAYTSALWPRSRLTAPGQPRTLFELFEASVARHPEQPCFMHRPRHPAFAPSPSTTKEYSDYLVGTSYATVQTRRNAIGSALLALERSGSLKAVNVDPAQVSPAEITFPGVPYFGNQNRAKHGARRGWAVGLWSKNREEWQMVDLACHAYGLVGVSLYETLGPDVAEFVTNHCPLSIVFSAENHITDLLRIAKKCPTLRVIVSIDPLPPATFRLLKEWASSVHIDLRLLSELEEWGASEGIRCDPGPVKGIAGEEQLDADRVATISYTSGTTGNPKGVVLTNKCLVQSAISNTLGSTKELTEDTFRFMSFLPLSHIYERFTQIVVMHGDGTICFSTGDVTKLLEDAAIIKPHLFISVPRVLNRIDAAVRLQMSQPGLKGALLRRAVATKLKNWRETGEVKHSFWDALVFRKIRNLLGGEIRYISSGASPLSASVHEMIKVVMSCDVVQGFGMTESVGTCCRGVPWDIGAPGTCGALQPCNDAKLVDVVEMGYTAEDQPNPRGELCLRGANITVGYLHDPESTAKSIDKDGWFHTGDVAEIDAQGRIKIIDRIKNVVKLAQGEYVALERVEGVYLGNAHFTSLLIHGDSTQSSVVAIGVLDPIRASDLVQKVLHQTVAPDDAVNLEKAVQEPKVRQELVRQLAEQARVAKLNGFEMIRAIRLTINPFPPHIITPTMKIKRNIAAKLYRADIDEMYAEVERGAGNQAIAKL